VYICDSINTKWCDIDSYGVTAAALFKLTLFHPGRIIHAVTYSRCQRSPSRDVTTIVQCDSGTAVMFNQWRVWSESNTGCPCKQLHGTALCLHTDCRQTTCSVFYYKTMMQLISATNSQPEYTTNAVGVKEVVVWLMSRLLTDLPHAHMLATIQGSITRPKWCPQTDAFSAY